MKASQRDSCGHTGRGSVQCLSQSLVQHLMYTPCRPQQAPRLLAAGMAEVLCSFVDAVLNFKGYHTAQLVPCGGTSTHALTWWQQGPHGHLMGS